jgi:hypothetical protein
MLSVLMSTFYVDVDKRDRVLRPPPPGLGVPKRRVPPALGCEEGLDQLQLITHQYLAIPKRTCLARSGSPVDQPSEFSFLIG